jgi:hypothetical protein
MKNLGAATIFTEGLSTYLNMSFWNRTPRELDRGFWSGALWDIRKRFGRDFTDRMVAYAIRAMIDEPTKSSTDNLSHYLINQLKIGESVVDNDGKRWTTVLEILRSHGVITDQLAS